MREDARESKDQLQRRLDALRRLIGITSCETLLPALELYTMELARRLEQGKLH